MKINIKELVNTIEREEEQVSETEIQEESEAESLETEEETEVEIEEENPDAETQVEPEEEIPEAETQAEEEKELEIESESNAEAEDSSEQKADEDKVDTELEEEPEKNVEIESAEANETQSESKISSLKKYKDLFVIGLAFIVLFATAFYYTEMIPREVCATVDGETKNYTTTAWTIGEFLESENISYCEEDFVSVPVTGFVRDDLQLEMVHAYDYKITADGETFDYKTLEKTVGEALKEEGIKLGKLDIVEPGLKKPVKNGMTIVVKRVVVEKEVVEEVIKFKTIKKEDPTMNEGKKKVVQEGKNGKAKVTYRVTYIDGKESKRKKIKSEVITPRKNKIVKVGTRVTIDGFAYSRKLVVKAYSYTGGGRTAMGTQARVGEIAVDPKVIPLGSKVYIEGVGVRYAEDTGGNIKGNTIDIYMNTMSECKNWGVRYVTIYIE